MKEDTYLLKRVGIVRSPYSSREECPKQGWEGGSEAWLEIDAPFGDALDGLRPGQQVFLLTWMHEAERELLKVHPRGDASRPPRGVFSTRSPDRPNPIGLHPVEVLEFETPCRLRVRPLDVLDGTPIVDIKPVLSGEGERWQKKM